MDPQNIAIQQNISVGLLLAEPAQIDYFGCMGTITADTIIYFFVLPNYFQQANFGNRRPRKCIKRFKKKTNIIRKYI